ncbi:hypothetical protein F909_03884 [Acinetobacter sp. ANC 3929]|uniref:hypothetical protein n=1 Tax=Acinetobacter sp. ANC 3929 TaxID=1217707 RepID=UPI0002D0951F|nr:hypothetical protein [Acinetobacter sp. ANC 3929]ENW78198.1 hypothetical protein F909_03884 [Acinetobacter sp. ANC 3929]
MGNIEIELPIQLLEAATICASKKDIRKVLIGVAFSHGHITSCDGHRAFACPIKGLDENVELIIPLDDIKHFLKQVPSKHRHEICKVIFDPHAKKGEIVITEKNVAARILFVAIDGKYPDWRRIFPKDLPPSINYEGSIPQFNWQYLADFQKVHKILGGDGLNVGFRALSAREVAGIFFRGGPFEDGRVFQDVKACLMPMRI